MWLPRKNFERLCRARDLLIQGDESSGRPMSVMDVALRLELSPFQLIRQFEAVFGETPAQFRIRTRLERARELLALDTLSVTDVCLEVGFESLGSFSALFTRRVGESPSSFRRRIRPMIQVPGVIPKPLIPGCFSLMAMLPPGAFRNSGEAPRPRPS